MNALLAQLHLALVFLTRLPLPPLRSLPEGGLARAMRMFPLAGAVVGGLAALAYLFGRLLFPPPLAALLALAASLLATGCLHEDGLADMTDGFGGGKDKAGKLEIMRDSRIGSYGVAALVMSLALRAAALAGFADPWRAAAALVAAHALSRGMIPLVMQMMTPARDNGLGHGAGQPSHTDAAAALLLAALLALLLLPLPQAALAVAAGALAALAVTRLALHHLGGHTGDVLGAVEQAVEVAVLLAVLAK
ncbi:cobalamin synthase [mine drainage metagenome]|uniref:Adenosylcobinamide-GDP ribazoletransferase n=1 Tax=mine drainage metagenome TaxID=410659 RepID=A0A1J5SMM3_9ZZZZ